jgi:hypothetical protein
VSRALPLLALALALCPALGSAAGCEDGPPDWMGTIPLSRSSAPVRPAGCARVEQTPPDFSWPDFGPGSRYEFRLTYPDGTARSSATERNWIAWSEALPPGEYRWQVRLVPKTGQGADSRTRRFVVEAGAVPFVVPEWRTLFERASARPRPRALPGDRDPLFASLASERGEGLERLIKEVDGSLGSVPQGEPAARSATPYWREVHDEARRTLHAAVAWIATKDERYFAEALRRTQNLARWNPRGITSHANADETSRDIAWTLSLAYDWLSPRLDAAQKRAVLASLKVRVGDMYDDVIGERARVAIHPYDSHGNETLTYLAAMSTLLAGDLPEAQAWLRDALPLAIRWTSPWGGEDGGFGNGSAYATWLTGDLLVAWNVMRWVVDVDLSRKAWVRHYANFLAYFTPPGTPTGVFGDGAELALTEAWARYGKAYTRFAPSPLGRWWASQVGGEDSARLELLLAAPAAPGPAPFPKGTPNAALFPSIGWAAMHSDLADPARTSVYFKSSMFGSYNHSHADQDSFVVVAKGRSLAIDSGYYDGYRTPHWLQWYKQTRAHNAITFDGGQGQVVFEESNQLGPGAITAHAFRPDYDVVSGDATQAYGGALKEAKRSLVYLRPDLILVYDRLASAQARQWEWNIHALHRIEVPGDRRIAIREGDASLCVEMLAGPPTAFTQTDRFTAPPQGNAPAQWHGAFVSKERSGEAEFVALLRVGCGAEPVAVERAQHGWVVKLPGRSVSLEDGRAEVRETRRTR